MKSENILSSLCYFSVLFAPFLFPIVIWILASGNVRHHAGKALWTHFAPYLCVFFGISALALNVGHQTTTSVMIIIVFSLIAIYYFISNFVRGIKLLIES